MANTLYRLENILIHVQSRALLRHDDTDFRILFLRPILEQLASILLEAKTCFFVLTHSPQPSNPSKVDTACYSVPLLVNQPVHDYFNRITFLGGMEGNNHLMWFLFTCCWCSSNISCLVLGYSSCLGLSITRSLNTLNKYPLRIITVCWNVLW